MTPEERQMLGGLFERVNAASADAARPAGGSLHQRRRSRRRPTRLTCWLRPCSFSSRPWRPPPSRIAELEAAAQPRLNSSRSRASFLGNLGKSMFGGGAPSAPPHPSYDASASSAGPAAAGIPVCASAAPAAGPPRPPQRWPVGAAPRRPEAEASSRTPCRPRPASPAASRLATCLAACSAAIRAAEACSAAASAAPGFRAAAARRSTTSTKLRPTAIDSGQFEPSMPDDAGYLDDSSFDDSSRRRLRRRLIHRSIARNSGRRAPRRGGLRRRWRFSAAPARRFR